MARQLIKAAENHGGTLRRVDDVAHNIYRWEKGQVGVSERYRLYYCEALGIPPDRFGLAAEAAGSAPGEPPQAAVEDAKSIVILISVPKGMEARVRVVSQGDSPLPRTYGPQGTAGERTPVIDTGQSG